jgi:branched-chain amino acid transport system permease protein
VTAVTAPAAPGQDQTGRRARLAAVLNLLPRFGWLVFPLSYLYVLIGPDAYYQYVAGFVIIYALSALGLDWLMGRAGVVSLGNGAIMAFGALVASYLAQHSWASFPLVLLVVTVLGGVLGFVISLPARRLLGIYFALVTLALQVLVVFAGQGYQGTNRNFLGGIPLPSANVGPWQLNLGRGWLIVLGILLTVTVVLLRNMYRGQPGRSWMAIRESEMAARTIGVAAQRAKLPAFVGSSALIALSGALLAYYTGRVNPSSYTLTFAISFVVMVIVGGLRSLSGVLLGATIVTVLPLWLGQYASNLPPLAGGITGWFENNVFFINSGLFGLLVLIVLLYMPDGIVPSLVTAAARGRAALLRQQAGKPLSSPRPARPVSAGAGATSGPDMAGRSVAIDSPGRTAETGHVTVTGPVTLQVRDLFLTYSNGARALTGLNLTVDEGEIVGVVGRNGVGKTSLMRALTGFYRSEGVRVTGEIVFGGQPIAGSSPVRTAGAGIVLVPERGKVFPSLTVSEHLKQIGNAEVARDIMPGEWPAFERRWNIQAGLLSGGERQLLALTVAASLRPRLLLVDEMSLGLAPLAIERVADAIRDLRTRAGLTIILVEQNTDVAARLCNRVLVMEGGRIVGGLVPAGADQKAGPSATGAKAGSGVPADRAAAADGWSADA